MGIAISPTSTSSATAEAQGSTPSRITGRAPMASPEQPHHPDLMYTTSASTLLVIIWSDFGGFEDDKVE